MNLFPSEQRPLSHHLVSENLRWGSDDEDVDSDEIIAIRKRRLRILLVDDHELFRASVAFHLREVYGAEVHEEETGEGAVEAASEGFDLILMDIKMPGSLDGLDACAEIRRRSLPVQVALMTAQTTTEWTDRANAMEAYLLSKPLDYKIVERMLLACPGGSPT